MLSKYIRVIHSDNGVLTDHSLASQNRTDTFSLPLVKDEDYIYVGQYYPTNNIYFSLGTVNSNASNIKIEIWNNEWVEAVDILDGTSVSGASMARSGVIQWDIDKDNLGWSEVHDPTKEPVAFGITTLKIYDLYWFRISFSENLSAGSTIKQVSYKFCSDADLKAKAPDINDYLGSWETGKTDWNEQILEASTELVNYLKVQGLIASASNILRFDEVSTACAYLALSIIHNGIGGDDFIAQSGREYAMFLKHIKNMPLVIDVNKNASVDKHQEVSKIYQGSLYR